MHAEQGCAALVRHHGYGDAGGHRAGQRVLIPQHAAEEALAGGAYEDGAPEVERGRYVATMAYPMVAVALMYHLAHNAGHFFGEGLRIVPVLSDPLGYGWDLFGSASVKVVPLLSMPAIWATWIAMWPTSSMSPEPIEYQGSITQSWPNETFRPASISSRTRVMPRRFG